MSRKIETILILEYLYIVKAQQSYSKTIDFHFNINDALTV